MYVFYELTSLCSMPLVLHELTHDAVTGAMKYLYYSIGGAFFVLFGIVVLYTNTSTLDFAPGGTLIAGQHTGLELLAVFFVVLGFGTKAGLFPMHNWLPSAHPVAPAPPAPCCRASLPRRALSASSGYCTSSPVPLRCGVHGFRRPVWCWRWGRCS